MTDGAKRFAAWRRTVWMAAIALTLVGVGFGLGRWSAALGRRPGEPDPAEPDVVQLSRELEQKQALYASDPSTWNAQSLTETHAALAQALASAGRYEEAIRHLQEGCGVEDRHGLGMEYSAAKYVWGDLLVESVNKDQCYVLALLRSTSVSHDQKAEIMDYMRDELLSEEQPPPAGNRP